MQDRMLSSLGLLMEELGTAKEVTIQLENKIIRIEGATVVYIDSPTGRIYQIVGGREIESAPAVEVEKHAYEPTPEDVALVASQAGVDEEAARGALIEAGGDLARAILSLKAKKL